MEMTSPADVTRRGLTGLLLAGLVAVFAGGRVFGDVEIVGISLIALGGFAVSAATALQIVRSRGAEGPSRSVERVFALTYTGCWLALAGFVLGTESVLDWSGLEFGGPRARIRFLRGLLVVSTILMTTSLLPALAAEWAARKGGLIGFHRVDGLRVRESAANAASVAMAASALMLIGYVASARNHTLDVSYFKTSRPGDAVQEIVRTMNAPLRILLFFPEVSPVKDETRIYFEELRRATANVVVEEYDRFADPATAAEYDVRSDGDIVLRVGEQRERIGLPVGLDPARARLRVLDGEVQQALLMLTRERRVAYLTTGHGELNDAGPTLDRDSGAVGTDPPLAALRQLLGLLNYEVRDFGLQRGLGDRIPEDAAMVLILGPALAFLEPEVAAILAYLDQGGSVLLALEPGSDFRLDSFHGRLGVAVDPWMTIDEARHLRETGADADRRLIVTNRFSPHPAVTTVSRQGAGSGILMMGPRQIRVAEDVPGRTASLIVRSLPSSFSDLNGNFRFDGASETRGEFGLAAAVEAVGRSETPSMRALVVGDAEIFTDPVLSSLGMNAAFVADGVRWLGREEAFAGQVVSEKDAPIVHTRAEDVAWFYAMIFGAPSVIVLAGFGMLVRRRGADKSGGVA